MFNVESNARKRAEARKARMISEGWKPESAAKVAEQHEGREIREGNKWIEENVGLN